MKQVGYINPGIIEYNDCWSLQQSLFDGLLSEKNLSDGKKAPSYGQNLILCEHPHVYTLGKSGHESNMLISEEILQKIGASYVRIDRGGDITYHGPGQLVGYPVLDLDKFGLGLKEYIYLLEECIIRTVADYNICGERSTGATGVWIAADTVRPLRKIAAIGVRSSRFVTMHGFSLNVAPSMDYFSYINPCGFTDRGVTSIHIETGEKPDMEQVKANFKKYFAEIFGCELTDMAPGDLPQLTDRGI